MLDPRIYRAGFVPLVLVAIVVAFSLRDAPGGLTAALAPGAFDGQRALTALTEMARQHPIRTPGSAGDRALANELASALSADGFGVMRRSFDAVTPSGERRLQTISAVRAGTANGTIAIVADRSSPLAGATAQLSGTAALWELGRVFQTRTFDHTLMLISTSGGPAGAADVAAHLSGQVDGVIVLGDLAGRISRRPWVLPWSEQPAVAPLVLQRTVAAAVATEVGAPAGASGVAAQFARLAFPLTLGAQGPLLAAGLPAVELQVSGERGPGAERVVDPARLLAFGRAALRAVTALDGGPATSPPPTAVLVTSNKVLPGWAVRALVGFLILPVLMAVVDGFARALRRDESTVQWVAAVLVSAVPFLVGAALAWLLGALGLIAAPAVPAAGGVVPVGAADAVALAICLIGVALSWLALRPVLLERVGAPGPPGLGAAAAVAIVLCALTLGTWLANPFAAALLIAPLHVWLALVLPEVRVRRDLAIAGVLAALLPIAAVIGYYAVALAVTPLELARDLMLLVAGGHIGLLAVLALVTLLAILWSVLTIVVSAPALGAAPGRRGGPGVPRGEQSIRGPAGYAGPGSLGGTESALRR